MHQARLAFALTFGSVRGGEFYLIISNKWTVNIVFDLNIYF